jgi:hypothetical protein
MPQFLFLDQISSKLGLLRMAIRRKRRLALRLKEEGGGTTLGEEFCKERERALVS